MICLSSCFLVLFIAFVCSKLVKAAVNRYYNIKSTNKASLWPGRYYKLEVCLTQSHI